MRSAKIMELDLAGAATKSRAIVCGIATQQGKIQLAKEVVVCSHHMGARVGAARRMH